MNRGKYAAPRRRRRRSTLKPLLVAMAVVLLIGCVAGGTLAWLTSTPSAVTNTFTTSDINITLTETDRTYKMIPGWTIDKDPKVTVTKGSEKCYVFVKVTESSNFGSFMTYDIASGWTQLQNENGNVGGVYYRVAETATVNQTFAVLKDNKVSVRDNVNKEAMNALTTTSYPTLTFQAAAIQYNDSNSTYFEPADAYAKIDWTAAPTTGSTN